MSDQVLPEIMTEILIRLPVKTLLICRSVCKKWCSLISDPIFTSQHLSRSSSKTLIVRHTTTEFYIRVVGSCNGLLCLADDIFLQKDRTVVLWNPCIKRAVITPVPNNTFSMRALYILALGFGFVAKTNDYKIVRAAYDYKDQRGLDDLSLPHLVEVFSLSSNTWTTVVNPMFANKVKSFVTDHFWSQATVGSVVHWVMYKLNAEDQQLILRFDLESERFVGELGFPESLAHKPPKILHATVLRGLFSILCYDESYGDVFATGNVETTCTVWVMKEYDDVGSWTQLCKVSLESGVGKVLGMKREGELVVCDSWGDLFTYNCKNGEFTGMGIRGPRYIYFVDEYVESLVLLGKGKTVEVQKNENEDGRVENDELMRKIAFMSSTASMILGNAPLM